MIAGGHPSCANTGEDGAHGDWRDQGYPPCPREFCRVLTGSDGMRWNLTSGLRRKCLKLPRFHEPAECEPARAASGSHRRPPRTLNRARTSSGSDDRSMSKRSSTEVAFLRGFWPSAPIDRTNRSRISRSSTTKSLAIRICLFPGRRNVTPPSDRLTFYRRPGAINGPRESN